MEGWGSSPLVSGGGGAAGGWGKGAVGMGGVRGVGRSLRSPVLAQHF